MKIELFNKIQPCNKLSVPDFDMKNGVKLIHSLLAKDSLRGDLVEISTFNPDEVFAPCITFVSGVGNSYPSASHSFTINKQKKFFDGISMNVYNFYKSRGYGELMRLASIIHMKENGVVKNNIEALSKAIPFHYKYGFRPDFANIEAIKNTSFADTSGADSPFNFIRGTLLYLTQNKGLSSNSVEQAYLLLDKLFVNKSLPKEDLARLDSLMIEYIEKHLDNWDKDLMIDDIPMSLSMSKVQENAPFYNKLFEKHSIDYGV